VSFDRTSLQQAERQKLDLTTGLHRFVEIETTPVAPQSMREQMGRHI
jgi:hypothetical protein